MPEYTIASLLYLAAATGAMAWRGLFRDRRVLIALAAFGVMTVGFDLLLTGLPIVTYGDQFRSGVAVGPMPIEDLLYGMALAMTALIAADVASGRGGHAAGRTHEGSKR